MGEDWHHKKARQYRRHTEALAPAPLFERSEEIEKQYMGHLDDCDCEVTTDQIVTLFLSGPRACPALLIGTAVIGRMEDDSASDAAQSATSWPLVVQMRVVERTPKNKTLVLSPSKRSQGRI